MCPSTSCGRSSVAWKPRRTTKAAIFRATEDHCGNEDADLKVALALITSSRMPIMALGSDSGARARALGRQEGLPRSFPGQSVNI